MLLNIARYILKAPGSWVMAVPFAIAAFAAQAGEVKVEDYRPVFQECHHDGAARFAIRRLTIDGQGRVLTVDPATLATNLEPDGDWSCADTDDARQADTRFIRAVRAASAPHGASAVIVNGGLVHGVGDGSFVTGDLCPSHRPLDRRFLEALETPGAPVPVALSLSGEWLTHHAVDFEWLRDQERAGALAITWVDHSYHHRYVPGLAPAENFMLMPGTDMRAEILDTERLLIAGGETPSVFFRFPGLISNAALMRQAADYHLIVLGGDAWLAKTGQAKPGAIILVHPNGNELVGLAIFKSLAAAGKLPKPFRPIDEAP